MHQPEAAGEYADRGGGVRKAIGAARRFTTMTWGERALFGRAFVRIAAVELGLRRHGFHEYLLRAPAPAHSNVAPAEIVRARTYARWVGAAARRHPVRARCLHRSLALHGWLRQEGIPSTFRIGIRKDGGELAAHAWVEVDGQVINDPESAIAAFVPLFDAMSAAGPGGGPPTVNVRSA